MRRKTPMWLLASLAFASLTFLADGAPLKLMSAPNLLRVGASENVFLECQDCPNNHPDIRVEINVMNHPTKNKRLASAFVTLTRANDFQQIGKITIPAGDFSRDANIKQYVYLQAHFPDRVLEKVVLVSFQSGYIFIQTDKPLYTPKSKVQYRMFAVTPQMEPVERDEATQTDTTISIDIVSPDGIIFPLDPVSPAAGIINGGYNIAAVVSLGVWKMVARFKTNPQQSYTAEFEVKEYVLPSFEVKLIPVTQFFYVDSAELSINIHATYLFGEEVDGAGYAVFGVIVDGQKNSFTSSLQRVQIVKGLGKVTLKKEHITEAFKDILRLVGKPIFVAVSVLTENGGEMVEAELRNVMIVTSPYTIHFRKTSKYYKPGISFDVAVEVLNPDESPAKGVDVMINPGEVIGRTSSNGMARLTVNTAAATRSMNIVARTNDPLLSAERQATAKMEAARYNTKSNRYIHIGLDAPELSVGDNLKINLNVISDPNHRHEITYLILSRGQLVQNGRYQTSGELLITLSFPVTKDMLPSFRIVAFYHTADNEVVSDSVWVDVKDNCKGSLKLESSRAAASYEPRRAFILRATGDPGATVGLVAVDKGVYVLNNNYRLTQKKVWDIVEKHDTGCTPGGGKDSMSVFYDAGLMFESSLGSGTAYRQESKCPDQGRSKRATTVMELVSNLVRKFQNKLENDCCKEGIKKALNTYTCETRSEYIVDGQECIDAFMDCCTEYEREMGEKTEERLQLARSEDENSYMDSSEITSRTQFPESWLWTNMQLPSCPAATPNCQTTSAEKGIALPGSITTWMMSGISLSKTEGICVSDTLEVVVRKDFFIDLRLPYSAVRGEQLEVKAILHNYIPERITVRVDLIEELNLCTSASKRGRFRQEVKIDAMTTRAVPFVIIPMKEGTFSVEVKAAVKDSSLNDGISKKLLVVPEGVLIKSPQIVILDPTNEGVDGKQTIIVNSRIPETEVVPGTHTSTQISVTGVEQVAPLVENAISGMSLGTLIYQPSGCGEQNMIHMTLPLIAAVYLDKTNQWENVGFQKRAEALQHITTGYKNELTYRKPDGSFAVWKKHQSSTWLTAYVVKVFSMANSLVAVQSDIICGAVRFLILNAQQPDGVFREVGRVSHIEMTGDVLGTDSDASMTAFCLIALQESRTLCSATVNSLPSSIDKSVNYLKKRLHSLTNPYAVAMVSYAMANEQDLNSEVLFKFVSPELSHWPVPNGHILTLEATAYALLALVKSKAFEDARPVVRWFNKQQNVGKGYGSTQATIMVYQAVAEYWTSAKEPPYDLDVDLTLEGRATTLRYKFNQQNQFSTRTTDINKINQDVKVVATGTGEATLTVVSLYYALPKVKESDCQKFNLSVQLIPEKMDGEEKIYKLRIDVMYKDTQRDATMSILDIGLLTGFTPNTNDLDLISKGRARTIAKYEMDTLLSERGSLIIYLDKVSHTRPEEITFRINQKFRVGVLQPAVVSVYEYYEQKHCVKYYHPERRDGHLMRLCIGDECTCAEENCSMQKKGKIDNNKRSQMACETTPSSKIDFVYKVALEGITYSLSTDIYKMRIVEVIKEGNNDVGPLGGLRDFLSYPHCREALDLQEGRTYLIMGMSSDIHKDVKAQKYQYILGERAWIEYWPTKSECQNDKYRPICLGMEQLVQEYSVFGCEQ